MRTQVSCEVAPVTVEAHPRDGDGVCVTLSGEIDRDNCSEVRVAVDEVLFGAGPPHISLDMSRVTFLDSAGIRTLLLCRRDARLRGCELDIAAVHPHVYQVLDVTGLLGEFNVA